MVHSSQLRNSTLYLKKNLVQNNITITLRNQRVRPSEKTTNPIFNTLRIYRVACPRGVTNSGNDLRNHSVPRPCRGHNTIYDP
jgi:hypothetical protein